jgi:nicotinamide riboside kinase
MVSRRRLLIVLTGPESTGKTTLSRALGQRLGWPVLPELARERLEHRPSYSLQDVCRLALLQYRLIEEALATAPAVLADTDLLTYRIWLQWRYGHCPEWLRLLHWCQRPALYLLCAPDLPWAEDPLRENPHDRQALLEAHRQILDAENLPCTLITGQGDTRLQTAWESIRDRVGEWVTD